jgi:hypothetical protein
MQFISHVLREGKPSDEELDKVVRATKESKYLFDEDYCTYIKTMHDKGVKI